MWIILTDQNHRKSTIVFSVFDFRTQKHQSSNNSEAGVSVHSDHGAVHAGLMGQQSGVVAEDGAADVDGVKDVRVQSLRTVQIRSDADGSDGQE